MTFDQIMNTLLKTDGKMNLHEHYTVNSLHFGMTFAKNTTEWINKENDSQNSTGWKKERKKERKKKWKWKRSVGKAHTPTLHLFIDYKTACRLHNLASNFRLTLIFDPYVVQLSWRHSMFWVGLYMHGDPWSFLYYPVMLSHFSPAPVKTDRAVRIQ